MKKLLLVLSLLLLSTLGFGQQQHQATIAYTASTTPGCTYNVYRALCNGSLTGTPPTCPTLSEGTFAKITATPISTTSYTDITVVLGNNYSYYVTCYVNPQTVESNPSMHVGASLIQPNPPTSPSLTQVAMNTFGSTETVLATGSAPAGNTVTYTLGDGTGHVIAFGSMTADNNDSFTHNWSFKKVKTTPNLTVCVGTSCVSKSAS